MAYGHTPWAVHYVLQDLIQVCIQHQFGGFFMVPAVWVVHVVVCLFIIIPAQSFVVLGSFDYESLRECPQEQQGASLHPNVPTPNGTPSTDQADERADPDQNPPLRVKLHARSRFSFFLSFFLSISLSLSFPSSVFPE